MKLQIGAHVSISGGLDKAVERAAAMGANCMQLFSGSPRMWRQKDLSKYHPKKMFSKKEKLNVKSVFIHAKYLINLASNKSDLIRKSVRSLSHDLKVDNLIKGDGVVVHLGSHQGRGWSKMKQQVADQIKNILDQTPDSSRLLIENSAGQKGKVASDLAQIRWLLDEVAAGKRLAWCFDTCHAFAAGYKLSGRGSVLTKITKLDLWNSLACVHVNDSKVEFNSGDDKHANIGEGKIPQDMFEGFLKDKRVQAVPLITEVPGMDGNGPDKENLDRIKNLL